jgi:hypothetical protein
MHVYRRISIVVVAMLCVYLGLYQRDFRFLLPHSSTNNKVKEEVARLFYFKLYYVSMVVMFFIPQIVMQVIMVWFPRPSRQ